MSVREFVLKVIGDTTGAEKSLGKLGDTTKSTFGDVAKVAAGAFTGAAVIKFGKDIVSAASDAEQSLGAAQAVFGDFSGDIEDFSKTTAKNLGLSAGDFNQMAAQTGALLKGAGLPLEEVTDKTINLTERASDLAAMFGGTAQQAMEAMQSALKGEMDPMEKFGVSMNQAAIQAEAMSMGLVKMEVDAGKLADAQDGLTKANTRYKEAVAKHGKGSKEAEEALMALEKAERRVDKVMEGKEPKLTAAQKAQAAYSLMMKQSADAQGAGAREADTLAGVTARLGAQFKDLQANLGAKLLPILAKVGEWLIKLVEYIERNQSWLVPLVATIASFAAGLKLASIAMGILNAVMALNPAVAIGLAIAGIIAGLVVLYNKVEWFRNAVDAVVDVFQNLWEVIKVGFQWVIDHWQLLLTVITGPIGAAVVIVVRYWDQITGAVKAVFNWIKDHWQLLLGIITGPIGAAVILVVKYWDEIVAAVKTAIEGVKIAVKVVTDIVTWPFKEAYRLVKEAIDKIPAIFDSMKSAIERAVKTVTGVIEWPFREGWRLASNVFGKVYDFFVGIKDSINRALKGLQDILEYPFKQAIAGIKWLWNSTIGGFGVTIPDIPGMPGRGKRFEIPEMARGGIVTRPTLALIGEAGPEAVVPLGSTFGGVTINVYALTANAEVGRKVYEALREYERTSGVRLAS